MLKQVLMAGLVSVGLVFALAPLDAEAKRLGGGKSAGMQRSAPDKPAQATPAQPAAPTQAAASPNTPGPAAAAAPKRSWMGPIAGLAAGLGLAALFSHLGMGEGLANAVMMVLLALVAFVAIRFLMRRFMGGGVQPTLATAAAGAGAARAAPPTQFVDERPGMQRTATPVAPVVTIGSALAAPQATAPAAVTTPAGFDTEGFERLAKMLFIRMQAANDSADLADLRNFTTPELFASLRLDLQERGAAPQATDVVEVNAKLIDFDQEAERQVVSVRFTGQVKEDAAADATPFDEVWHLVQPADGSRPWAIAGIQQAQ
jgi:predicted lipid-binding transport protein (Tim44 family)